MYYVSKKECPLSRDDRDWHLSIKQKRETINAERMVIRMNSTYLEWVDGAYEARGSVGAFSLVPICLFLVLTPYLWLQLIWRIYLTPVSQIQNPGNTIFYTAIATLMLGTLFVMFLALVWHVGEWFGYTHYPLRFNRQNRTVYVFMGKGKPLEFAWDELYFVLGWGGLWRRVICAHALKDPQTIACSFFFGSSQYGSAFALQQWEFIRRYMEEGPESVMGAWRFDVCPPLADKRESLYQGWRSLFNYYGGPIVGYLMVPVTLCCFIGRLINRATSKIPYWPAEVEAVCQIDPNDPYVRDERQNPAWFQG